MISVVIPAHDEEQVIRRCLEAFVPAAQPGEIEVVVVCNACTDRTAAIAREFGSPVTVVEVDRPSKTNALNLGEEAVTGFPRVYMDADVVMSLEDLRHLVSPLEHGQALASAPAVETVFRPDTNWAVRAYYNFWMALPFVQEGMMAAGVYALSAAGRRRFERFPEIIADDGFVRLQFNSDERVEVADAVSRVHAPTAWMDLIRIKTRSRLGVYQLRGAFPELSAAEARSKRYGQALLSIARRPGLYIDAIPFLAVSLISRSRASMQAKRGGYLWERDTSSRA
jgi:glycosyltransferase involved in cell wall biosynthesis